MSWPSRLFGPFDVFFKTNGMTISEKGVSTNTSDSEGITIYSLGSETNIFSFLTVPGARSMPVKINLHKNFFSVYKKHVPATFFWEFWQITNSVKLTKISWLQQKYPNHTWFPINQHFMILEPSRKSIYSLSSGRIHSHTSQGKSLSFSDRECIVSFLQPFVIHLPIHSFIHFTSKYF